MTADRQTTPHRHRFREFWEKDLKGGLLFSGSLTGICGLAMYGLLAIYSRPLPADQTENGGASSCTPLQQSWNKAAGDRRPLIAQSPDTTPAQRTACVSNPSIHTGGPR